MVDRNGKNDRGVGRDGLSPPMLGSFPQLFEVDAQSLASFDDPARDAWQMPERVIAALGLVTGQTVADIGAGTGYFTARLARATGSSSQA